MSNEKKTILLKITGEVLPHLEEGLDGSMVENLASQVKELLPSYRFGIVIGGGNFFRGAYPGKLAISTNVSHTVGMLATVMNGLIIQDIFEQKGISTSFFTALPQETVGESLSPEKLRVALKEKDCLIFGGGSGNPYFTTDTTAVVRALQIGAYELWKGTKVDGIYSADPKIVPTARFLERVRYEEALTQRYAIMDLPAFALAEQHKIPLRIFNIFREKALLNAAQDRSFGSTVFYY